MIYLLFKILNVFILPGAGALVSLIALAGLSLGIYLVVKFLTRDDMGDVTRLVIEQLFFTGFF